MTELSSAQIIPFPSRPPVRNAAHHPRRGEVSQLTRALTALDAAVIDQRAAITAWRDSLTTLTCSTAGLGAGVADYHTSLAALDADLTALSGQAQVLVHWADGPRPAPR